MQTSTARRLARLQSWLFVALFLGVIGLAAYLSTRYHIQADWTAGGRNTLSPASRDVLAALDGPLQITVYARKDQALREQVKAFLDRYRRYKPDIDIRYVNPDLDPQRARELNVGNGALVLHYRGREETLHVLGEQHMANALHRLARNGERWVAYLTGHGERDLRGKKNSDLGNFGSELERKGFKLEPVNLAKTHDIPENASILVIAGPQVDLLPGEMKAIRRWLERGGNLLWLTDPGPQHGLDALGDELGVSIVPGTLVDPNALLNQISPTYTLIGEYPSQAITQGFSLTTVFPLAAGLQREEGGGWHVRPFLTTQPNSWNETGKLEGAVRPDADQGEHLGPFDIGLALTRAHAVTDKDGKEKSVQQRVAVIGDGDFLSNNYLGNGGNLDLGLAVFEWLGHDDKLINVRAKTAPDTHLTLSRRASSIIGLGFLFGIPLALLGGGFWIWWRRRRR